MLVRDAPQFPQGPRLEVFMVRRNPRSVFVGGAYVFPGGQVDGADASVDLLDRGVGVTAEQADAALGTPGALRFWVAAIRESFEEAGVLLARTRTREANGALLDPSGDAARTLARERLRLMRGETDLAGVLDAHAAVLDLGALIPFGRWITPPGAPRRFDTWFFLAHAPDGHAYRHDDDEMVASEWVRPSDALCRARSGEIELIYPTIRSLLVMRRYPTATALLGAAQARWTRPRPLRVMDRGLGWQLDLTTDDEHRADDAASTFVTGMDLAPEATRARRVGAVAGG
jgi:8-oxo-dGTP pyrophosphatase MutT (NUDIX family)